MAKKNMSFLPEDYLQKRQARRTNLLCIVLFVIVMGGVVTAYLFTDWQRREVREQQKQVNARFREAARRLEQLEKLQNRKEQMIHKARVTSALVERIPRSLLLAELINHMPNQLSLTDFNLETEVVRERSRPRTSLERRKRELDKKSEDELKVKVPKTRMHVTLNGVAPTDVQVAQFMTALGQHRLFNDVNLQFSEEAEIEQQKMRKFEIKMAISDNVNVEQIEPTRIERELKQNPMADKMKIDPDDVMTGGDNVRPVSDPQAQE